MTEERKMEYHRCYMKMAYVMSSLSYAKRHKVGCIIVNPDGQIISQGYNGTPSGYDNTCETEEFDGYKKCTADKYCPHGLRQPCYCCSEYGIPQYKLVTKPEVLHAESNAISKCVKSGHSTKDATVYVTLSPCIDCAKLIVQSGIKAVYYSEAYRDLSGVEFLKKCGIQVYELPIEQ